MELGLYQGNLYAGTYAGVFLWILGVPQMQGPCVTDNSQAMTSLTCFSTSLLLQFCVSLQTMSDWLLSTEQQNCNAVVLDVQCLVQQALQQSEQNF